MKNYLFKILLLVFCLLPKDLKADAYVKITIEGQEGWVPIKGTVSDGIFTLSSECIAGNISGEIDLNYIRENNDGTGASYKIKNISQKAFWYSGINSIIIPEDIEYIAQQAFTYCTALKAPKIPSSCTMIGYEAFQGCNNIESLVIPEGVTDIGTGAFKRCRYLRYLELPSTLKRLRESIIAECNNLETIELKEGLETIDEGALEGYLTDLTIPETVKTIGAYVFGLRPKIKSLIFKGIPEKIDERAFALVGSSYSPCKLNYPKEWSLAKWIVSSITWYGGYFTFVDDESMAIIPAIKDNNSMEYYDINGTPVSTPKKGIIIRRSQNGEVQKIILKDN